MTDRVESLKSWFSPARFALVTAGIIVACFPGVLLGRETFFFRDYAIFSYPLAAYHKECFWRGELPLWNPYNDCGLPFLAQWNTMVLYPLSLIYLLLPLTWSLAFFCLFHMWMGGIGMFFLARAWTQNNVAAALAGLAFLFSGVVLSCLKWPNNIAALGWMPWVVFAVERGYRGNARSVAIASAVGAMQMLTGAPEVIVLTWAFLGVLVLAEVISRRNGWMRITGKFIGIVILVACVSAAQLLPFLDLLQHSQRDENFRGSQWPMPPWGLANFILPLFRMFPSYHDVHGQPGQSWISTYYVSIPILLLAIYALLKVRERKVWLMGLVLLFSIWMAFGERAMLYKWLRAAVPGLGMMRFPIKFIVLSAFVIPLLGAYGVKQIIEKSAAIKPRAIWIPAVVLAATICGLILYSEFNPYKYSRAFVTTRNGLWRILFLLCAAAVFATRSRSAIPWLFLAGLTVTDALTHSTWHNPVTPSWVYTGIGVTLERKPALGAGRVFVSPEAVNTMDRLMLDTPAADVLASRASLYCNLNLLEDIPKVDGFYAIYPRAMSQFQDRVYNSTNLPPSGLLDFLGATAVTAAGIWDQWVSRDSALPLITSPTRLRQGQAGIRDLLDPEFNPSDEVFAADLGITDHLERAAIKSVAWTPHHISFECSALGPAFVAISQTFYHGWEATIDGQPAKIIGANYAFQGLIVPAGTHNVELKYRDAAFRMGRVLSITCVIALGMLMTRRNKQNHENGKG